MESSLKCNTLLCRTELKDEAVVTSCLHVFCIDCASRGNLITPGAEHLRQCPACRSPLPGPDNAVHVNLRPTDDYKGSILRGLSPVAVIDCANAALNFWEYQMAQEIVYHAYFEQTLTEKYSQSRAELDKITGEANGQIGMLSDKLSAVTLERDSVRRKNDELLVMLKEKNKKLMQVQELYDKLKRKAMLGSLQDGASEAVDTALDRVAAIGATPVAADRYQRLGLYQQQADNSKLHGGLQPRITNTWDQQLRRDRIAATPEHRSHSNNTAGIRLSNIPGLVVGGAPLLNQDRRHGLRTEHQYLNGVSGNPGYGGASTGNGFGLNTGGTTDALPGGAIGLSSAQKPNLNQRPGAGIFAPQPRNSPQWRQ
ncbi:hypothetical protein M0657_002888 [Pyricularia oryzae]|nr:hypothetical protein M9X92_003728 [Pyricularia oryzae]KAI7928047.1 hypothetical protein M0657_002888 [Pyricularia oryzae]